jgi:hypothetical protein
MTDLLMLDSIDVHEFHGLKFDALAGYVGGSWPSFSPECATYPGLHKQGRIISIAVTASEQAEILDCEAGDATPRQCGPWLKAQLERGVWKPGIYSSSSQMPLVEASIQASGIKRDQIRLWVAKWTYHPGVMAGFEAQQWSDSYQHRNIDASTATEAFFPPSPQPAHRNEPHYDWFGDGPFHSHRWGLLSERKTVEEYDGALQQPDKYKLHIPLLEVRLRWLAHRVAWVAIHGDPNTDGSPSWGIDRRGWRYQQLIRRSHGTRFV